MAAGKQKDRERKANFYLLLDLINWGFQSKSHSTSFF